MKPLMKPIGQMVLIKADEPEIKTESGIYMPEVDESKPLTATVISIGDECKFVKESDRLLIRNGNGLKVNDLLLLREIDIIAIIEESDEK